jgi:hypothetical protein
VDQLYGRGFTLSGLLEDEPIDRRLVMTARGRAATT